MKTFKLLALAVLFAFTLFACEDPLEEMAPIMEEPTITTDGTGGGTGGDRPCGVGCE